MTKIGVHRVKAVFSEGTMRQAFKESKAEQLVTIANALGFGDLHPIELTLRHKVEMELYSMALRQALVMEFDASQAACLLNILKAVHDDSMSRFSLIEVAFDLFKEHLLAHSVERPPFSRAVFTPQACQKLTRWALESYFDYYKMYLYAFRNRIAKTVHSSAPGEGLVEVPKSSALSALNDARNEEEYAASQAAVRVAKEEEERKRREEEDAKLNDPEKKAQRIREAADEATAAARARLEAKLEPSKEALSLRIEHLKQRLPQDK